MRNFLLVIAVGLAIPACARAQSHGVPEGYTQVMKVGRITVHAESKSALSTEQQSKIQKALKSLNERYTAQFGLDREIYKPGTLKTLVEPKSTVELVLFQDLVRFQDWLGVLGAAGVTIHTGRYENVVGVPLEDGEVSEKFWWVLAHEFSHVFYSHCIRTGGPVWMNEGIAEYFASTSKLYAATDHEHFRGMLKRLEERRGSGAANGVPALLLKPQQEFGRPEYDEAWLLVHLLITEFPGHLNDLFSAVRAFEQDAWENLDGVQGDIRAYAADLLEKGFGGRDKLQAAFDQHLDAMLANPAEPARIKIRPVGIPMAPILPEIESKLTGSATLLQDDDGNTYRARHSSGTVKFRAPWKAEVQMFIAVGDDKGNWSEEYVLVHAGTMKAGDRESWEDEAIPRYKNARRARVTAEWTVQGGGTYRTVKEFLFK